MPQRRLKIGFDVDNVITDFTLGFLAEAQKRGFPVSRLYSARDLQDYWFTEALPADRVHPAWAVLRRDGDFWDSLPLLATDAEIEAINRLADRHRVFFVTRRSDLDRGLVSRFTLRWLHNHGIFAAGLDRVVATHSKEVTIHRLGLDSYLDDNPADALCAKIGGARAFLLDLPYNRPFDVRELGIVRVYDIREYISMVEAIFNV